MSKGIYYAKSDKDAQDYIRANYGEVCFSRTQRRYYTSRDYCVAVFESSCDCGFCTGYDVENELGEPEILIKACESCYWDAPMRERLD